MAKRKTGIGNKIINKPARELARSGRPKIADLITFPTREYRYNKRIIQETIKTITKLTTKNKLTLHETDYGNKFVLLIFPFSFFGPQSRQSRLQEQKTLLKFLNQALLSIDEMGLSVVMKNDRKPLKQGDKVGVIATLSYHTFGRFPRTLHYKVGDLPNYIVIDPEGYSGWSSICHIEKDKIDIIPESIAIEWYEKFFNIVQKTKITKYDQNAPEEKLRISQAYVFIPLQMKGDSTQKLAWMSMLEMLDLVAYAFRNLPFKVVVKRHPLCNDAEVERKIQNLYESGLILTSEDSIHDLIKDCTAVFTVNSGVGSEALTYLKPVYTFGQCDYQFGTHKIKDRETLEAAINDIALPHSELVIKKFLYFYRNEYLLNIDNESCRDYIKSKLTIASQSRAIASTIACQQSG